MSRIKKLLAAVRAILSKGRVLHYLDYFLAGAILWLASHHQQILTGHSWHALVYGAAGAGVKATLELYRKSGKPGLLAALIEAAAAKKPPAK